MTTEDTELVAAIRDLRDALDHPERHYPSDSVTAAVSTVDLTVALDELDRLRAVLARTAAGRDLTAQDAIRADERHRIAEASHQVRRQMYMDGRPEERLRGWSAFAGWIRAGCPVETDVRDDTTPAVVRTDGQPPAQKLCFAALPGQPSDFGNLVARCGRPFGHDGSHEPLADASDTDEPRETDRVSMALVVSALDAIRYLPRGEVRSGCHVDDGERVAERLRVAVRAARVELDRLRAVQPRRRSAAVQVWPDTIDDKPGLRYRTPTGGGFCTDGWACLADHASVRAVLGRHAAPADDTAAPDPDHTTEYRAVMAGYGTGSHGELDSLRRVYRPQIESGEIWIESRTVSPWIRVPDAGQPVRPSQDPTPTSGEELTDA